MLKCISWNVNGFRAVLKKGFLDFLTESKPDIIALQEIKLSANQIDFSLDEYYIYWNYAERKGYSGTAIFTKKKPLSITYGIGIEEHDKEGRVITLEYDTFFFVTVYTPNSKDGLLRLDYRMTWEDAFLDYLNSLKEKKAVIICGDLNVAHNEIDLKNPKSNTKNAGFTKEERNKFDNLISNAYIDTFRYLYPTKEFAYTWWSYRANARAKNTGWRIDYFLISDNLKPLLIDSKIHSDILGSDHCPIELNMDLTF